MIRGSMLALACAASLAAFATAGSAQAQVPGAPLPTQTPSGVALPGQQAYGQMWGRTYSTRDWNRFYHYPYVYYPQNFWSKEYYRSSDSLYYRYPSEMRVPVYNTRWHNMYPEGQIYHRGHHFILDVF